MTGKEKRKAGLLYDANDNQQLVAEMLGCKDHSHQINQLLPSNCPAKNARLRQMGIQDKGSPIVYAPFWCDFGYNIEIGENFFCNHNCVILDGARVTFGNNVFIAPNCGFYTAGHPLDAEQRNQGLEYAYPITVGNDVWICAGVQVMPGVTIGSGSVIGAGSVVTKDVPAGVVAVGNPCRAVRQITEEDRAKYAKR